MARNQRRITASTRRNYDAMTSGLCNLLQEKAFSDISVVEICEKSQIQRATFYSYFADKYTFYEFFIRDFFNAFAKKTVGVKFSTEEFFDKLIPYIDKFIQKNSQITTNILSAVDEKGNCIFEKSFAKCVLEMLNEKNVETELPRELVSDEIAAITATFLRWRLANVEYTETAMTEYAKRLFASEKFFTVPSEEDGE